jgi:hypothetical protein
MTSIEKLTLLVSIIAIVVSILTALRGNGLQARILELEQARDRAHAVETKRARVVAGYSEEPFVEIPAQTAAPKRRPGDRDRPSPSD